MLRWRLEGWRHPPLCFCQESGRQERKLILEHFAVRHILCNVILTYPNRGEKWFMFWVKILMTYEKCFTCIEDMAAFGKWVYHCSDSEGKKERKVVCIFQKIFMVFLLHTVLKYFSQGPCTVRKYFPRVFLLNLFSSERLILNYYLLLPIVQVSIVRLCDTYFST